MKKGEIALKLHCLDNVATLFMEAEAGDTVPVRDKQGKQFAIQARAAIPYGHKIALCDIPAGSQVIKYGESIGISTKEIHVGDYVHIHNLDSERGRGDKV